MAKIEAFKRALKALDYKNRVLVRGGWAIAVGHGSAVIQVRAALGIKGDAVVPAEPFFRFKPEEVAEIGGGQVDMRRGKARLTTKAPDAGGIRDVEAPLGAETACLPVAHIAAVSRFTSSEEARYYLRGAYLDAGEGHIVATNGHRLIAIPCEAKAGVLIHKDTMAAAVAIGDGGCRVGLVEDDAGRMSVALSGCEFHVGDFPIDGSFPAWRRVVPGDDKIIARAEIDAGQLGKDIAAAKRVLGKRTVVHFGGAITFGDYGGESDLDPGDAQELGFGEGRRVMVEHVEAVVSAAKLLGAEKITASLVKGGSTPVRFDFGGGAFALTMPLFK